MDAREIAKAINEVVDIVLTALACPLILLTGKTATGNDLQEDE